MDETFLNELNLHLSDKSYISDYSPSTADVELYDAVVGSDRLAFYPTKESTRYAHITRWACHISSFPDSCRAQFPAQKSSGAVETLLKKGRSLYSPPAKQKIDRMAPHSSNSSKPADAAADASDLPQTLLNLLNERGTVDSLSIAAELHEDHQKVVGAVNSLLSLTDVVESEQVSSKRLELTAEGNEIAETGSHESKVFNAIPAEGMPQAELMKVVPNAKIGFSKAMLNGWIELDKKAEGGPRV
uniref:Uncharacterized protein n=1 Tax=Plectus sambesii TaxID=2011161 RepID=A0A914WEB1_9BILA